MRTQFTRRRSVGAALVGLTMLGLAACGTAETPAAKGDTGPTLSSEPVTLRVTWWGGDARIERTQQVIAAFEEKYPTISVEGEYADWAGYWDKLATSTAGGNAPDVLQMDEMYLSSYADRGVLYDLESLSQQLDTSAIDPAVLDLGRAGDKLTAVPATTAAYSVLVNQDVLDQLGLTLPDTDSWTWDEFSDFAESVTEASGGEIVGTSRMDNSYSVRLWARQNGEELYTDDKVSITQGTMASYFQQHLDWTKSGAAAPASKQAEQMSVAIDQKDFSLGKQAMLFSQVTQAATYAAALNDANLIAVPIPTGDATPDDFMYLKPGMYWSASATTKHPAEAAAFIDFIVNDIEAGEAIGMERGTPVNPAVREAIAPSLSAAEKVAADFTDSLEGSLGAAPEITPNGGSEGDAILARYQQEVIFERLTPEDAAAAYIDDLQAALDTAK